MAASLSELAHALSAPEASALGPLAAARHSGAHFLHAGLDWPAAKAEAWKHTALTALSEHSWHATPAAADAATLAQAEALLHKSAADGPRLVFIDGVPAPTLSRQTTQAGVQLDSLEHVGGADAEVRGHLGALGLHTDEAFAALNTAMLSHGAFVTLAANVVMAAPLSIVFISSQAASDALVQPRVLVVAGANSQGTVIERHLALGQAVCWNNAVSEVVVDSGARLNYVVQQSAAQNAYHLATIGVRIGRDAYCSLTTLDDGAKLCRRGIRMELLAQGADAHLSHVALANGEQHVATQASIRHLSGHTTSHQVYKSVADGRSTTSFNGTVEIAENAPQVNAKQLSRALLRAPQAKAFLRPQLVILTDDVKCAHGATIGALDEGALFYLQSRGLPAQQAQQLLTFAFLGEALANAPEGVRPLLVERIALWLGATADMGLTPADWEAAT